MKKMNKLNAKYCARIFDKPLNAIEYVKGPGRLPLDTSIHRSSIYLAEIKFKEERPIKVLYKVVNRPEYKFATHHEEIVLSTSHVLSTRIPQLHYITPKLLDHIYDEQTLVMEYIEGTSLAHKIEVLDKHLNEIEKELRRNNKSPLEKKIFWDKRNAINEIKIAFVKLALRGLAEFQYYSRLYIDDFKDALKARNNKLKSNPEFKRELVLYNPLEHDSKDHYRIRIVDNLFELLNKYKIGYDRSKLTTLLLNPDPLGRTPIESLVEAINDYDSERVIIADYHPLHIIPQHNDEINSAIKDVASMNNKMLDQKDLEILIKRIIDEGIVGLTDLGDVRIGPELFDFIDLTRNHICDLRRNEVDESLLYFLRERQHLRGKDVGQLYAEYHERFIMLDTYRALRAAVKSDKEWEKLFYLDHISEDLFYHSSLEPLKNVILSYIESVSEKIQSIVDKKNNIKINPGASNKKLNNHKVYA